MKPSLFTLLLLSLLTAVTFGQQNSLSNLDLGFEKKPAQSISWENFGGSNYTISLDSTVAHNGRQSAVIKFKDGAGAPEFKAIAFNLPKNYDGRKITLSGYIKTENVSEGYAGLWMRIDPQIAFDNMNQNGVKGSSDWKPCEITLNLNPGKTDRIIIGALLVGKGKMWIDDLTVKIDGKDFQKAKPYIRTFLPAELDKEFDNGSGITNIPLNKAKTENLKWLGLIWGFLKYYHPNIADGKFNWDYELFRILPGIINAKDNSSRDVLLLEWINKLGGFEESIETPLKNTPVKFEADIAWINNPALSKDLRSILNRIKNSKKPKSNFYIGFTQVGNPDFKNEKPYASMKYPDAGFRLLSLYRYWNMIQYWFPYKNLIERDWKDVLQEYIPKTINAKNEIDYTLSSLQLIGEIHDTHANIWGGNTVLGNYFGTRYAPLELTFLENKPVVTGYYNDSLGKESGLVKGDIIKSINGVEVSQLVRSGLKYTPASNYPTQLRDLARKLLQTNDSLINIEFVRESKTNRAMLRTFTSKEVNIYSKFSTKDTCFKMLDHNIAYINNGSLKKKYLPAIWEDMKRAKGLIIDCRNYPSEFVIYDLSSYIIPESTDFVKFTQSSLDHPGLFSFGGTLKAGKERKDSFKGKVVILVNEISQSSSEFHAMAYSVHPNATVIGSTTAGADGNVSSIQLPGGISSMISGIGVYYPNGKETQRIGIVPDIEVKPTIEGIKAGKDEVLEKAIEIISSNKTE